jgi:hypothetical protein
MQCWRYSTHHGNATIEQKQVLALGRSSGAREVIPWIE